MLVVALVLNVCTAEPPVKDDDDGGAQSSAIGNLVVNGIPGITYGSPGGLSTLRFIAASGSPLLNVSFYKSP